MEELNKLITPIKSAAFINGLLVGSMISFAVSALAVYLGM